MTDKPRRRYDLHIHVGANDLPYLKHLLEEIADNLKDEQPYECVSGGYSGSYSAIMLVDLNMTHDSYMAANNAYLESLDKQKEGQG